MHKKLKFATGIVFTKGSKNRFEIENFGRIEWNFDQKSWSEISVRIRGVA